jgi:dTDP-glucose 4,6-dehydratase
MFVKAQRAAEQGRTGEVFHFATPQNISIRMLSNLLPKESGVDFEEHVEVQGERFGKDAAYLLDCLIAKERLQWEPKIKLEEGVKSTIQWVNENLDDLVVSPQDYIHKP